MDILEYYSKLQELVTASSKQLAQQAVVPAAQELLAETKNRIQSDGKKSDGSSIGQYSTKTAYYGREAFDKKSSFKPPTGKKTMKLEQGYKQLRQIQGKPTTDINETYTGSTLAAFQNQITEDAVLQGFTTELSSKIRKGQEAKRGNIFNPTDTELTDYKKNVINNTKEITEQIFK